MLDKILQFIKNNLQYSLSILLIAIIIVSGLVYLIRRPDTAEAEWWNDTWLYRQTIAITNSGSAQTNTQVKILSGVDLSALVTAGKLQADLDDLRFTDINGTVLKYWIEDATDSSVDIWAFLSSAPATGASVFMYYGNVSATSDVVALGSAEYPGISCQAINKSATTTDGIYYIDPNGQESADKFQIYCDLNEDDGGWSLIMKSRADTTTFHYSSGYWTTANTYQTTDIGVNVGDSKFSIFNTFPFTSLRGCVDSPTTNCIIRTFGTDKTSALALFSEAETSSCIDTDDGGSLTFADFETVFSIDMYDGPCEGGPVFNKPDCGGGAGDDPVRWGVYTDEDITCASNNEALGWGLTNDVTAPGSAGSGGYAARMTHVGKNSWLWVREDIVSTTGHTVTAGSPASEEQGIGPVSYWKFDEGVDNTCSDGDDICDSAGSGNNGIIAGTHSWQTEDMCISGKCLQLSDGAYVDVTAMVLDLSEDHSISTWFKINQWDTYANGAGLVSGPNSRGWDDVITIYTGSINLQDDTGAGKSVSVSIGLNTWYYLTLNIKTSGIEVYLDGVYKNSTSAFSSANTFTIDRIGRAYGHDTLIGLFDEFKIYDYARTEAQVLTDYNAGLAGVSSASGVSVALGGQSSKWLSDGLVGYWKMDESSGDLVDASGNGYTGTVTGTSVVTGKYGSGRDFGTVSSSRVDIGDLSPFDFGANDFTISGWAKIDGTYSSSRGSLVNKWNTGANPGTNEFVCSVGYGANKTPHLTFASSSTSYSATSPTEISSDEWHHIVCVRRADKIFIFVDGEEMDNTDVGSLAIDNVGRSLYVGNIYNNGSYGYSFDGDLDEIRIYNRALSHREVKDLYNWAPGPIGYWNFQEGSGTTTTYDRSGNGNNGTMNGSMTEDDWVLGKVGSALDFDGGDDYISGASNLGLLGDAQFTMSAWMKWTGDSWSTGYPSIIGNNSTGTTNQGLSLTMKDGKPAVDFWTNRFRATSALSVDTWYHIAVTKTPGVISTTSIIYVNGVVVAGAVEGSDTTPSIVDAVPVIARLDATRWFEGVIDEVKIYDYVRTPKQIVSDMNAGHPAGGSPVGSQTAYWKFDEGYGTTIYDSSGHSNTGAFNNDTTWVNEGKFGKAVYLDGDADYITITEDSIQQDYSEMTVSAWIKPTLADHGRVLMGSGTNSFYYKIQTTSNDMCAALYQGGVSTDWQCSGVGITLNEWTYVSFTFDSVTGIIKHYINGKYVAQNSTTTGSTDCSATEFYIGYDGTYYFHGYIDELKVYNFILTDDEVLIDYNQGASIVLGAGGTDSAGNSDNSAARTYCIPGDTATCDPPAGEWKLDEKTGSSAYDTSNNENTGTISNGTWKSAADCIKGACMLFDGDDKILVSDDSALDLTTTGTVSVWAKINSYTNGQYPHIVGKGASAGWDSNGYAIWIYSDTAVRGELDDEAQTPSNDYVSFGKPSTGEWHQYVMTWDGSTIYAYLDGALSTATPSSDTQRFPVPNTAVNLEMGARSHYFNGQIDDVKLYNYARTAAQVAWDYNRGAPIGWWKMDECSGTIINDWAPNSNGGYNGNNGTLTIGGTGSQTVVGDCEIAGSAWDNGETGVINSSMSFDGTDDYFTVANDSLLNPGVGDFSFTMWVKNTGNDTAINSLITRYSGGDGYLFRITAVGIPQIQIYGDTTQIVTSSTTDIGADSTWHHLAFTVDRDSATGLDIYIDGVESAYSAQGDISALNGVTIAPSSSLFIGLEYDGSSFPFAGQIDDVRIFNYDLTSAQIKTIMNNGAVNFK